MGNHDTRGGGAVNWAGLVKKVTGVWAACGLLGGVAGTVGMLACLEVTVSQLPDYFASYPQAPTALTVSSAIARLIDGLGFRLYWTLEGLREADCAYRPAESANSIGDILSHMLELVNWVHVSVFGQPMPQPPDTIEQGHAMLRALETLRKHFIEISDEQLVSYRLGDRPFWSIINMPLSDLLHHEGEVRILRHACGNPPRGLARRNKS